MSTPGRRLSPCGLFARREDFVRHGISPELYAEPHREAQRLRARAIGALFSQLKRGLREAWQGCKRRTLLVSQ